MAGPRRGSVSVSVIQQPTANQPSDQSQMVPNIPEQTRPKTNRKQIMEMFKSKASLSQVIY